MKAAALARHLAELGLGTYEGAGAGPPVFLCDATGMPDKPDIAIGIFTLPSFPRSEPTIPYELPELQVQVRHPGFDGARSRPGSELTDSIRRALDGTDNTVWAASTEDELSVLWCIANSSGPIPLGPDITGRPRWSVSFQIETPIQEVTP